MVSTSMLALGSSLLATLTLAQQYPIESVAFQLRATSIDGSNKFNQTPLGACHSGALIEGLCLNPDGGPVFFNHNTSANAQPLLPNHTPDGILVTNSPGTNFSQPMAFNLHYSTNVAQAMFGGLAEEVLVSFDTNTQRMTIIDSYDDTHTPPSVNEVYTSYEKWWACQTNYAAYEYVTINWLYGENPTNPSCSAVAVERVYVPN